MILVHAHILRFDVFNSKLIIDDNCDDDGRGSCHHLVNTSGLSLTTTISTVHTSGPSSFFTRAVGQGALEFQQGAADFVAKGGMTLLVVNWSLTPETAHKSWLCTGCGGGGTSGVVMAGGAARGSAGGGTEHRHFDRVGC